MDIVTKKIQSSSTILYYKKFLFLNEKNDQYHPCHQYQKST